MVGGDFFQNETKVPHGQAGFHTCGGLAHEGLNSNWMNILKQIYLLQFSIEFDQENESKDFSRH